MIVKICGITRAEDALTAAALGATHVGLVFWPGSPRAVSREAAERISAALPDHVTIVGVFADATSETMNDMADAVGLDVLQLHGEETPGMARQLRRPIIKAIPLRAAVGAMVQPLPDASAGSDDEGSTQPLAAALRAAESWRGVPLLLDAHDPVRKGGTGTTIDWDCAAQVARRHDIILAGGLGPGNIGEAVARVRPAGVDISSGVEARPGIKDVSRLRALFAAIRKLEG